MFVCADLIRVTSHDDASSRAACVVNGQLVNGQRDAVQRSMDGLWISRTITKVPDHLRGNLQRLQSVQSPLSEATGDLQSASNVRAFEMSTSAPVEEI